MTETIPLPVAGFLDSNVLWGSGTTDLLMNFERIGLLTPRWSEQVFREVARTVSRAKPQANVESRLAAMRGAAPEAMVTGYRDLIPFMPADSADQHVLAAAIRCDAPVLVTDNVQHFWPERVQLPILVMSLDDFARALLIRDPDRVVHAVSTMVAEHRHPPRSVGEFIDMGRTGQNLRHFTRDLNEAVPAHQRSRYLARDQPVPALSPAAQRLAGVGGSRQPRHRSRAGTPRRPKRGMER